MNEVNRKRPRQKTADDEGFGVWVCKSLYFKGLESYPHPLIRVYFFRRFVD